MGSCNVKCVHAKLEQQGSLKPNECVLLEIVSIVPLNNIDVDLIISYKITRRFHCHF